VAKSFYIIDGHAQIYRSYYAPFRALTSPSGEPTRATYVFFSTLFNLIRERKPDYLAVALDVSDSTVFRCSIFPEYKSQRDPAPEDLPPQARRIISLIELMGIPILRKEGYEADDLMATIAKRLAGEEVAVYLVSRDKDLEQLINDRVFLFDPAKGELIDRAYLLENKGYAPEQVIDVQTLTGDTVDNIPGVPGIGIKTAAKLIEKYGSAAAVLAHADELTPKQGANVKAFASQMPITRQLVTLCGDVEFDFDLERAAYRGLHVDVVKPVFEELGFHRLLDQVEAFRRDDATAPPAAVPPAPACDAPQANYVLVDTPEAVADLAARLREVPAFAFDTETTGLNPIAASLVGISLAWEAGVAYYIPVRAAMGRVVPLDDIVRHLKPVFADESKFKVGQNLKYDINALRQVGIEVRGVGFDTLIASFVLDPLKRSHGLDALALEFCGHQMIPITELIGKGKAQISLDQVATDKVCEYAAEDADYTWRLAEVLRPRIAASPTRSLFEETEMPLVEVLAEMENNGVAVDTALLAKMSNQLADRLLELTREVHAAAGHEFNIDSTRQLANVLFDELRLPVVKKTKTGRSTDAETLEALVERTDHAVPRLMLEYREISKLKSTYLDTLPAMVCGRTGRIHAGFHQTGAVTGRLSSSDPNLQNIPIRTDAGRQIRGAFIAGDRDHVLIVADYSQIELRVLAHFSRDAALLDAFRSGQDIHATVAAQVNGVALADVTPAQRSAAKAVNFGIIYGQTAFGLARGLGISRPDAQDFIDRYYARYRGIKDFIDQVIEDTRKRGYAETMLGRRRPIVELNSRNRQQVALGERLAVNTVIQGTAAVLIKRAMIDIHREIKSRRLPLRMLIQVHDELVLETPRQKSGEMMELVRAKMCNALPLDVPIVVDIGEGDNWLEAK
jgi:DNA polymerase-1